MTDVDLSGRLSFYEMKPLILSMRHWMVRFGYLIVDVILPFYLNFVIDYWFPITYNCKMSFQVVFTKYAEKDTKMLSGRAWGIGAALKALGFR